MNFDILLFQKINQFAGKWLWLDTLAIFFAEYFSYILIFCLLLFLIKNFKKYWLMVVECLVSALLARFFIVDIIRLIFPRNRPFVENEINLLIPHLNSSSFPSGHAAFYFALSTIVYFYNKKTGILFFLASFLISISRIFSGLHWPSDILAGFIVGIFSGWLISIVSQKFFK